MDNESKRLTAELIEVCGWQWLAEQTADFLADHDYETGRPPTGEELLEYWRWLASELD